VGYRRRSFGRLIRMIGFYGFNPMQNPGTSRLFSPNVIQQGQQAFTQGYGQFKPFNEEDFAKQQEAAKAAALEAQASKKQTTGAIPGWNYAKQGFGGMSGFDAGMEARMIANLQRGKTLQQVAGVSMAGGRAPTREARDRSSAFQLLAKQYGLV